jgi:transmembrane sensor
MDTDTEVRVELTPTRRKLELVRGEAHFDVAHDVNRPFIVAAGKMAVRAVGTHFDVRKDRNAVEVTVGEGKVVFGAVDVVDAPISIVPPNVISLVAGQSVLADAGNTHLRTLSKQDVDRMLAWRNQLLIFDRDPLSRVVAQFNRYNKRQLVIADPSVAAVEIGGYFHPTNLDAFVGALQSDFGLRVASEGNRLVISAATKR